MSVLPVGQISFADFNISLEWPSNTTRTLSSMSDYAGVPENTLIRMVNLQ